MTHVQDNAARPYFSQQEAPQRLFVGDWVSAHSRATPRNYAAEKKSKEPLYVLMWNELEDARRKEHAEQRGVCSYLWKNREGMCGYIFVFAHIHIKDIWENIQMLTAEAVGKETGMRGWGRGKSAPCTLRAFCFVLGEGLLYSKN